MTQLKRYAVPTSGQVGPKLRVWGKPQQANFFKFTPCGNFEKIASVMTLALLAD